MNPSAPFRLPESILLLAAALLIGGHPLWARQAAPAAPSAGTSAPAPAAAGLNISLKDGRTINTSSLRVQSGNVMATVAVGTGTGEVGYAISTIAKIDFPEPPQIHTASDLLAQGKSAQALNQIEPIILFYAPFKAVLGNWWAPAAQLKLAALVSLQRDPEVQALIGELMNSSVDPEIARGAKVQLAATWERQGLHDKAVAVFDEEIKNSTSEDTLALAWLNKGHSLLAQKQWEPALLAYLHLPVFYPGQKLLLPAAMLGSARAREGIEDLTGAEETLNALIDQFPSSPEASVAKTELQKLSASSPGKS